MSHLTVDGFDIRFPNTGVSSSHILTLLGDAEEWIQSCLAEKFTVPFSSNNATARRIGYNKTFHLMRLRSLNPDDSDEMGDNLQGEIDALREGKKVMMIDDDTFLSAQPTQVDAGETIWSSTMDYIPTFDEDEPRRQKVNRDKINDLRAARR